MSQTNPCFSVPAVQVFWKHCGKRRNFYLFAELCTIFIKIVICKLFVWKSLKFVISERVKWNGFYGFIIIWGLVWYNALESWQPLQCFNQVNLVLQTVQIKIRLHRTCSLIFDLHCLLPYYRLWWKQPLNSDFWAAFPTCKSSTSLFSSLRLKSYSVW